MLLVVDCGSSKTGHFARIATLAGVLSETVKMQQLPQVQLNAYSHILISGAPILLTEVNPADYLPYFSGLKDTKCPILGVCFGHQITGLLHGATAMRCAEDRSWQTLEIVGNSPLFNGLQPDVEMMEDHCECISLPKGFELLASSQTCEVEAMKHPDRAWFGVQFHPEVSGAAGERLLRNFLSL